jgi:hypothetical protein
VQARLDVLAQLVVGRSRAVEDRDRCDVQARSRLLEVQEGRVEGGDAVAAGDAADCSTTDRSGPVVIV